MQEVSTRTLCCLLTDGMRRFLLSACIVALVLLATACGGGGKTSSVVCGGDTLKLNYAKNLCLVRCPDYTLAVIRNPWDTLKTLHTYALVERGDSVPGNLSDDITLIRVPLERCMIYSSVHCSLFNELGAIDCIAGICGLEYMNVPEIKEGCRSGKIMDCGNSLNPDMEKIIDLSPDAILLSPYEGGNGYDKIGRMHIPLVECADYMETSPLGRAEWMKFYGLLTGTYSRADSLFQETEKNYIRIKKSASDALSCPTVLCDLKYGSTWYISGGNSTTGQLYSDAGAAYVFADLKNSGSVPMAFETVFDKGQEAEYWFIKYNQPKDKTYHELAAEYAPYSRFRAFRERHIYGCNSARIPYYEETPFHPDWLLNDIVQILHPELSNNTSTRYFTNLAE